MNLNYLENFYNTEFAIYVCFVVVAGRSAEPKWNI